MSSYLFQDGVIRTSPFDLQPLEYFINRNLEDLVAYVKKAFQQGWPGADMEVSVRSTAEVVDGILLLEFGADGGDLRAVTVTSSATP